MSDNKMFSKTIKPFFSVKPTQRKFIKLIKAGKTLDDKKSELPKPNAIIYVT